MLQLRLSLWIITSFTVSPCPNSLENKGFDDCNLVCIYLPPKRMCVNIDLPSPHVFVNTFAFLVDTYRSCMFLGSLGTIP
jgi:hypothetical protein